MPTPALLLILATLLPLASFVILVFLGKRMGNPLAGYGGTGLQLFIFWELVGLCSYLLIGFWYEKKSASNAAIKAFVVNRVGDFGFLIGFGILFYNLGNVSLPNVWHLLGNAGQVTSGHVLMLPGAIDAAGHS